MYFSLLRNLQVLTVEVRQEDPGERACTSMQAITVLRHLWHRDARMNISACRSTAFVRCRSKLLSDVTTPVPDLPSR